MAEQDDCTQILTMRLKSCVVLSCVIVYHSSSKQCELLIKQSELLLSAFNKGFMGPW